MKPNHRFLVRPTAAAAALCASTAFAQGVATDAELDRVVVMRGREVFLSWSAEAEGYRLLELGSAR